MPKSASTSIQGSLNSKTDTSWTRERSHISDVLAADKQRKDVVLAQAEAMREAKERIVASMDGRGPLGALMKACYLDDMDAAKSALAAGAPVNGLDAHGDGALRVCAIFGRPGIMALLIEHGADANVPGRWGMTALDSAIDFNRLDCAEILLRSGARTDTRSVQVSKLPSSDLWEDDGDFHNVAPPNMDDPWGAIVPAGLPESILVETLRGEQPLARAADSRWSEAKMIRLLLSMGADPTDFDGFGCTALMQAAFAGDIVACSALIEGGADPHAVDVDGRDAMTHALIDLDDMDAQQFQTAFDRALATREARVLRDHTGGISLDGSAPGAKRI